MRCCAARPGRMAMSIWASRATTVDAAIAALEPLDYVVEIDERPGPGQSW